MSASSADGAGRAGSVLQALSAACLFSVSVPFGKTLLSGLRPIELSALCYLGGGLGLLAYRSLVRNSGARAAPLERADLPYVAGFTAAGGIAAPVLLFTGLELSSSSSASLLLNFELVFTSVIAVLFFGESGGRRFWLAAALITAGGMALSLEPGGTAFKPGSALVALASLMWGVDNNLTARVACKDPVTLGIVKGLAGGGVCAALAAFSGGTVPPAGVISLSLLLGALSYGASLVLLILAMRGLGAARAGAVFGAYPFTGALFSFLWLGERPGGRLVSALCLMGAAVLILLKERHSHPHLHPAMEHEHFHDHGDGHAHGHSGDAGSYSGRGHSHVHSHPEQEHDHEHLHGRHHLHGHP